MLHQTSLILGDSHECRTWMSSMIAKLSFKFTIFELFQHVSIIWLNIKNVVMKWYLSTAIWYVSQGNIKCSFSPVLKLGRTYKLFYSQSEMTPSVSEFHINSHLLFWASRGVTTDSLPNVQNNRIFDGVCRRKCINWRQGSRITWPVSRDNMVDVWSFHPPSLPN